MLIFSQSAMHGLYEALAGLLQIVPGNGEHPTRVELGYMPGMPVYLLNCRAQYVRHLVLESLRMALKQSRDL